MNEDSQREVVAFLERELGASCEIRRTHISIVALGGDRVLKLKRAVRFPYLDFSTPEKRLAMCEREIALNRRLAPMLYLAARRITREGRALSFDGAGELVDAVVEMRRFDEEFLLESLIKRGELTSALLERLARRLAAFHRDAPRDLARGGAEAMRRIASLNEQSLTATHLPPDTIGLLAAATKRALERHEALIDLRQSEGKARLGHGDLTLRNIAVVDGEPTPFDCLEFSDDLATADILYDLAFALMDLMKFGARDGANLLANRYLDALDESDGLPLLPLFISLRAAIRAHVNASQNRGEEARGYLSLALESLRVRAPCVVAIGGLSGSGKSTLAAALAPRLGAPPGARILNSDRLRKALFNAEPTRRLPPDAYRPEISRRIYARLIDETRRIAQTGWSVVADAVFDREEDRLAVAEAAQAAKLPFLGVWLDLDETERLRRVESRSGDVSDATREVAKAQSLGDAASLSWRRFRVDDALSRLDELAASL